VPQLDVPSENPNGTLPKNGIENVMSPGMIYGKNLCDAPVLPNGATVQIVLRRLAL